MSMCIYHGNCADEDVAAINDWHTMAAEALAKWENKA